MTARRLPFVQVDVFTARPLEGNALAVFTDARGLSPAQLQAIARETNLSETTFVLPDPAAPPGAPVAVRIFTAGEELPFAGHPTLGTAAVLRRAGAPEVTLSLGVGEIPVTFDGPFGEMRQRDPVFGPLHSRAEVARATGLAVDDLASDVPVQTVSTGLPYTLVPVRRLAALAALRLELSRAEDYLARTGGGLFYFVARETVDPAARLHARLVSRGGEDPATGSAAGCCVAWLLRHGVLASGEQLAIEQGLEVNRPSRILVRATRAGERVTDVRVGGNVVEVARGEYLLGEA